MSRSRDQEQTRPASHAGSWYEKNPKRLSSELDDNLSKVPDTLNGSSLPIPGARVIIGPHAGFRFSGPCAAWAYKALDLNGAKRVFLLGPSHTYYLAGCALSTFDKYRTPFGDLDVDVVTVDALMDTGKFSTIPPHREVDEHCLEMHIPYLWKRLEQTYGDDKSKYPPIVPIIVGDLKASQEKEFGKLLVPYLNDPENAFIISSDFCHWGKNYRYRPQLINGVYQNPDASSNKKTVLKIQPKVNSSDPDGPAPHEVIKALDDMAIAAAETGVHDNFYSTVEGTDNSVCGRHPIGVVMAALEELAREADLDAGKGKFKFVQYQRSGLVEDLDDFSVSYASAYAVL